MSTYLYDEALVKKIRDWTHATKIQVLGVNETSRLFEIIADENDDKPISLPLITISRGRGYNIINDGTTKRMMSYEGLSYDRHIYHKGTKDAYTTTSSIMGIPISLSYQLDVYTNFAKEADILMRNLIFNLINYPAFEIEIPTSHANHIARITVNDTVEDNSDIPERFVAGNFTRLSLVITVDDAYLWDVRELHDVTIDLMLDTTNETWVWNEDRTELIPVEITESEVVRLPDPVTLI